jgi:hypothetical protein
VLISLGNVKDSMVKRSGIAVKLVACKALKDAILG